MPTDDLLNASKFLDEPVKAETSSNVALDLLGGATANKTEQRARSFLPDTWNIAGFDTGIPMSKDTAAFLVGAGDGLSDTVDGLSQIFGTAETKQSLQEDQNAMKELYNDPRFGGTARVGQFTGFFADPVGVILPMGKGKNLWDVAKIGAATGTAFGALGYVDEQEGQTRAGNALVGMVTGGAMSPALFGAAGAVKGVGNKIQRHAASNLLDTYKRQYYKYMAQGANPTQATQHAMKQMGWTTRDKVELIHASGKPFNIDTLQSINKKTKAPQTINGRPVFDEAQAARNTRALQSRLITKASDFLDKSEAGKSAKELAQNVAKGVNHLIVPVATRIAKLDPDLGRDLITFEATVHKRQRDFHEELSGFTTTMEKMFKQNPDVAARVQLAAMNGRKKEAGRLYIQNGGKAEDWARVQKILRQIHKEYNDAGYNLKMIDGFFPRRVRDLDGLQAHQDIGQEEAIRAFKERMRREPNEYELQRMIDNITNPYMGGRYQTAGSLNKRTIEELEKEQAKFYHDMDKTMMSYVNDAVTDIERSKFLRKIGVDSKRQFEIDGSDVTDTLNDVIRKRQGTGAYNAKEVKDITDMLRSRFTQGEVAPEKAVQMFKNASYIAALGNVKSAMTQIGDIAFAAHKNGIINVALELLNRLPGAKHIVGNSHKRVTKEMIGLEDAIQDFAGNGNLKKELDFVLKWTGFKNMDKLGKETFINSHIRKVRNQLNGKNGGQERSRLLTKWRNVFGDETDQMVKDLKEGKFSDNVGLYLFNQLEDIQPIALSSMPQAYLNNPNGRIMYMLKSFTLKQFDVMRRDILTNMAKGDYPEAFKQLTSFGSLFVAANGSADMLKDFMTGKEIEMEDTLVDNVWKLLGVNRYTVDKVGRDGLGSTIIDVVAPPLTVWDRVLKSPESTSNAWKASPFNGLQIFDEMFNSGELTRTESDTYNSQLDYIHRGFDNE